MTRFFLLLFGMIFAVAGVLMISFSLFAQTPAPNPDPKVSVPVSLLQALVNAGQKAPGEVINPLTDQVKAMVNEQLVSAGPARAEAKPLPAEAPQGAPVHRPLPEPEKK